MAILVTEDFKTDRRGVEYGLDRSSCAELAADCVEKSCFDLSFLLIKREAVVDLGLLSAWGVEGSEMNEEEADQLDFEV